MAFDFPTSPTTGQVSNGYTYDGIGWAGGPGVSGPQTEQWFDVSGLTTLDITVPTWAGGMHIEGSVWTTNFVYMRVSWDGTTFLAGASDYTNAGPYHDAGGGAAAYATIASALSTALTLAWSADTAIVPLQFDGNMRLVAAVGQRATLRTISTSYNAAAGQRHYSIMAFPMTGGGRVQKLRILTSGGTAFAAGSWIKVHWLGDSAAIPQTNAISDCPADGNEYVRCNGVWRLKKQDWVAAGGEPYIDIIPPSWNPKRARVSFAIVPNNTTPAALGMRGSMDGTTFPASATDYYNVAMYGQAAAAGNALYAPAAGYTFAYLSYSGNNQSVPYSGEAYIDLERSGSGTFMCISTIHWYGAGGYGIGTLGTYFSGAFGSGGTRMKALRFFVTNSVPLAAGSRITTEWL